MATSKKYISGWFFLILGISIICSSIAVGLFAPQWVSMVANIVGVQHANIWPFWITSSLFIAALLLMISLYMFRTAWAERRKILSSGAFIDAYKEIIGDCKKYIKVYFPNDAENEIIRLLSQLEIKLDSALQEINISGNYDIDDIEKEFISKIPLEYKHQLSMLFSQMNRTEGKIIPRKPPEKSFEAFKQSEFQRHQKALKILPTVSEREKHISALEGRGESLIEQIPTLLQLQLLDTQLTTLCDDYLQPNSEDSDVQEIAKSSIRKLLKAFTLSEEQMQKTLELLRKFQVYGELYQNQASALRKWVANQLPRTPGAKSAMAGGQREDKPYSNASAPVSPTAATPTPPLEMPQLRPQTQTQISPAEAAVAANPAGTSKVGSSMATSIANNVLPTATTSVPPKEGICVPLPSAMDSSTPSKTRGEDEERLTPNEH